MSDIPVSNIDGTENQDEFLASLLTTLVYKNGGHMTIKGLSDMAGKSIMIECYGDKENDSVELFAHEHGKELPQ